MFDVAVIGAGVIGAFVARELSRYDLKIAIIEKGSDVSGGASRANSGIVHAGFDAAEGSLKAKFNLLGNIKMPQVCKELGVKYEKNGSLVITDSEEGVEGLVKLLRRGKENGVEELYLLTGEEVKKIEPNITDSVVAALYAKTGGIVCPYGLTIAAVGNAMDNGAELYTDFSVESVKDNGDGWELIDENGKCIRAKYVINCAGAGSQKIANLFGDFSFKIGARKGEYMLLDNCSNGFVKSTIFTLPTKAGKGILVSPTVDKNVLIGPTSIEQEDFNKDVRIPAFDEIKEKASAMCKNIPYQNTITSFAGVRAYSDRGDFIIEESKVKNLFNASGIESPGLTSAPAIGEYVAKFVAEKFNAREKNNFNPNRRPHDYFKSLSIEEKNALIKERPEYGKIICRCEEVTLGEIIDAMRQNPKAKTVDGIKLRTRAGMGRCQSGFCQPQVLETIMKEYSLDYGEVLKGGKNSNIIIGGKR